MKRKSNYINHLFNFLAVIIGVYLAFYVNERGKINQDRNESKVLMHSLINDLSEDIKVYEEYQIPKNIEHQQNIGKLINSLSGNNTDSINSHLPLIFQVENFVPTTSTYSSMKSSGKLSLIESFDIRKNLSDYYEGLVIESIRKSEFQVDFFTNSVLPWVTNNIDLNEMKIINENETIVLRNKLIIYESLIDQKVNTYKMLVKESKELKDGIESKVEL